jgi:hypothetical protein
MQQWDLSSYDSTFTKLADARLDSVLVLPFWNITHEATRAFRVLTEPSTRTTWHGRVDHSIFSRREWLEFQIVTGELVFNHNTKLFGEPDWKEYPQVIAEPRPATPAVVVWRTEREHHLLSVASIWWGEPGQDAQEFLQLVLAQLPQPLSVEERFALIDHVPLTVLLAAEPSSERDALMRELEHPLVTVRSAHTVEETLANLDDTHVVIVADKLPPRTGEEAKRTYCMGFIRDELVQYDIPRIGWPVNVQRRQSQDDYPEVVMEHLQADCGRVLGGKPEPGREPLHHVLDALEVTATRV